MGDTERALEYTQAAVDMWRNRPGVEMSPSDSVGFAEALQILAKIHRRCGRFEEAIDLLEEADGIYERLDGGEAVTKIHRAALMLRRALVLAAARQCESALALAEQSMKLWHEVYPSDRFPKGHPAIVNALINSAVVNHAAGNTSRAAATLVEAARMGNELLVSSLAGLSETESLDLVAREGLLQAMLLSASRRSGQTQRRCMMSSGGNGASCTARLPIGRGYCAVRSHP